MMMTQAEAPPSAGMPPGLRPTGSCMPACTLGDRRLMASDTMAGQPYAGMHGFASLARTPPVAEAKKVFDALSAGGKVTMPMADLLGRVASACSSTASAPPGCSTPASRRRWAEAGRPPAALTARAAAALARSDRGRRAWLRRAPRRRAAAGSPRRRRLALEHGQADAGRDADQGVADAHRRAQRLHHLHRHHLGIGRFSQAFEDDGELVAGEPGDGVDAAHRREQPLGDDPEQRVAGAVAARVVDAP